MKVILKCPLPFMLVHGGAQIQIEQTKAGLSEIGVEVEYLRWWDDTQSGDILHYFGRIPTSYVQLSQRKGMKVILADLLTAQGSRTHWKQMLHKLFIKAMLGISPAYISKSFNWRSYQYADACVALTAWEAHLMKYLFDAPAEKVFVVPNGVEKQFFEATPLRRGPWLVCSATITERKRVLEMSRAAIVAQTPLWIIGKPYSETDPYAQEFVALARENPKWLRYEGPISDRSTLARVYREARGFVLLSAMESLSLSALEAAACECPLLLSELPWAKTVFESRASYCPVTKSTARTAQALKNFYDRCPDLPVPVKPHTWKEVAQELKRVYETVLKTS